MSGDLFAVEAPVVTERHPSPDWFNRIARRKLGQPEAWQWWKIQAVGDATLVVGAVPLGYVIKGPNKGAPKWPPVSASQTCVVTDLELEAEKAAYEQETGRCHICAGNGTRNWRYSSVTGPEYRDCERCKASGRAPSPQRGDG